MWYCPDKYKKTLPNLNEDFLNLKGELPDRQAKITLAKFMRSNLGFTKFGVIGYFEEDIPKEITLSSKGDPYMDFPENFYEWEELKTALDKVINPERRVHYGMFYAKSN